MFGMLERWKNGKMEATNAQMKDEYTNVSAMSKEFPELICRQPGIFEIIHNVIYLLYGHRLTIV